MAMTRPITELKVEPILISERGDYHMEQGAFKIEWIKNADNLTWDLTAWYVVDQRNQGFDK